LLGQRDIRILQLLNGHLQRADERGQVGDLGSGRCELGREVGDCSIQMGNLVREGSIGLLELSDLSVGIVQSNSEIVDLDSCRVQLGGEVGDSEI
jgi:hypothetical protein